MEINKIIINKISKNFISQFNLNFITINELLEAFKYYFIYIFRYKNDYEIDRFEFCQILKDFSTSNV